MDLDQGRDTEVFDKMVPEEVAYTLSLLFFPGLLFLLFLAFFSEWLDRKTVARLQNRYGPLYTGPRGILQPFTDFIKLLSKEDITPANADKSLFTMTPILLLSLSLTPLFMIPMADSTALVWFEGDLIIIMFITTMIALTMFVAAWSSTSRFSAIGGMRVGLQMFGYEIPMILAMVGPAISSGSLSVSRIVQRQNQGLWFLATQPIGFIVLTICLLAELQKVPFDIPKAETEIVTGWLVEFSGKKLGLIRLAENLEMVLAGSLMTSLYLGGPLGPWGLHPVIYFLGKLVVCILIISNLRALFARFRIDQALTGAWKYLTPLALLQVLLIELMSR